MLSDHEILKILPSSQKHSGFSNILSGMLLIAALLFCSAPAGLAAEENNLEVSGAESGLAGATTVEKDAFISEKMFCRGLEPINNLDELLYQFYINLDLDCLFYMPPSELERIWGIKILSRERAQGQELAKLRESSDFRNKPYESEKDAFFLEIHRRGPPTSARNKFDIQITSEYYKKQATLFPDGRFPKYLPEPTALRFDIRHSRGSSKTKKPAPRPAKKGRYDLPSLCYFWESSKKPKNIIRLISFSYGITMIIIY